MPRSFYAPYFAISGRILVAAGPDASALGRVWPPCRSGAVSGYVLPWRVGNGAFAVGSGALWELGGSLKGDWNMYGGWGVLVFGCRCSGLDTCLELQLPLALDDIPYQLQRFDRKPLHVRRAVTAPSLNLPRLGLSIPGNRKRNIPRRPIPSRSPGRSCCPALTNSIRAAQRLARVLC
jgi:hypothetical protein